MKKIWNLFLLTAFFIPIGWGAIPQIGIPFSKTFNCQDYKHHGQTWDSYQDNIGSMLFAHDDGILQYDGISWRLIPMKNHKKAVRIAGDNNQNIYIGGENEIGVLSPDRKGLYQYRSIASDTLNTGNIWDIAVLDTVVFFKTAQKLIMYHKISGRVVTKPLKLFSQLLKIEKEWYLFQKNQGLYKLHPNVMTSEQPLFHKLETAALYSAAPYPGKFTLVFDLTNGFQLYNAQSKTLKKPVKRRFYTNFQLYNAQSKTFKKWKNDIETLPGFQFPLKFIRLKTGHYLIIHPGLGVYLTDIHGKLIEHYDDKDLFFENIQLNVYEDNLGYVWFNGNTGIQYVDFKSPFRILNHKSGISGYPDFSIQFQGRLFTSSTSGFYELIPPTTPWEKSRFKQLFPDEKFFEAFKFKNNLLLSNRQTRILNTKEIIFPHSATDFFIPPYDTNRILVASSVGLYWLWETNGQWKNKPVKGATGYFKMACSYNKDHIIATDRFDNHYSLFLNTTQDSILKKEPLFPMNVESEKPATKLFHTRKALYQSAPDGLLKYNPANHSFQEMTLFDAYVAQHPLDILEPDADGLMWFWKNDSRGTGGSWGQTKNGEIIFDTTAFCRLGHLHIRDIDFFRNHTIFTTGKHLVLYKKDSRETNQKLYGYLASVYDIAADTIIHGPFRTPSDTTLLLKAAQNHLKFTITSNHICKDHVLYYLWDIEGLETGPVSWSTKPKKHFSNLKPGVYHTRFKIKDPYGKIYTLPSLQITIQKPWYLTPLALTAFGIIFIALFILIVLIIRFIHRKKTNNLAKEIARRTHELKIQNQELEKEKSTILELNNTKDKFFSIIAHDLRSPFSALMGLSEVLQEDYHQLDEKERLEIISHIRKSAEFSFSLLDNLLTWSRSQRNQIKPNPKEYHVADSIKEAIAPLESSLKRKQIHLNIDIDKNLKGYFDRNMAVTIFRNLVSNAIKFTNRGGVIELKGKKNQNEIIVSVTDNGIGISEEEQRNLFDIGKQTKRKGTEKESGTGLGLILCKDFAEQNHGHIEIQSELNKGSTFSVFLPKSPLNEKAEKATFSE